MKYVIFKVFLEIYNKNISSEILQVESAKGKMYLDFTTNRETVSERPSPKKHHIPKASNME